MTNSEATGLECIAADDGGCDGEVHEYRSRSGVTVSARCVAHQQAHDEKMDAVVADINERYPGWDNPASLPPAWFDPSYAGESWDEP